MATWTTPKLFVVGEILTANDLNVHLSDNLEFLRDRMLAPTKKVIVGEDVSSPASSVTFSDIPTDGDTVRVRVRARTTATGLSQRRTPVRMRLNGITAGVYRQIRLVTTSAGVTPDATVESSVNIGQATAEVGSGIQGFAEATIAGYTDSTRDLIGVFEGGAIPGAIESQNIHMDGFYRFADGPQGLVSVSFHLSSGNFEEGSVLELFVE